MSATKVNAEAIANLASQAADAMQTACILLNEAVELARNDYAHNGDKLENAYGALKLACSAVAGERYVWQDYARYRPEPARDGDNR